MLELRCIIYTIIYPFSVIANFPIHMNGAAVKKIHFLYVFFFKPLLGQFWDYTHIFYIKMFSESHGFSHYKQILASIWKFCEYSL